MKVELEYRKGFTKPEDTGKLIAETNFQGATRTRIDGGANFDTYAYSRVGTFENLTAIVREKGWKPLFIPMEEIK